MEDLLRDAFAALPRGEIDYEIGTDLRLNALEDEPREYTELMNVAQSKLVIGWRLGEAMEEPDFAALRVFASLFGGSTASKLFTNVREKLSLCYFASCVADLHKGLLLAYAGTDAERSEEARKEIFAQLAAIAQGCECDMVYLLAPDGGEEDGEEEEREISDEELAAFEEEENGDPETNV